MIELWYAPTPNGWKISIMLEECALPYRIRPLLLSRGEQREPAFASISPTGKMPAIVDFDAGDEGPPRAVFESGAILLYLADKVGEFIPNDMSGRLSVMSWLMWQVSGLGPTLGQLGHFLLYADEKITYAIDRFRKEAERHYRILDSQLARTGGFIAGTEYSIADIACFPWIMTHKAQGLSLADDYPHVADWFARIRARPAVQRGLAAGRDAFAEGDGLRVSGK